MLNKFFSSLLLLFLILNLNFTHHIIQPIKLPSSAKNPEKTNNKFSYSFTKQVKIEEVSPFFLIDDLMIIQYSPIVLLPSYEWYLEKDLDFYASDYIPAIFVNNINILDTMNITHDQLKKFGYSWDVTGFNGMTTPITVEYRLLDDLGKIIKNSSIQIFIDIPKITEFNYQRSEIHFGKSKDPYYYSGLSQGDFKIIFNPDGFIVKFVPNANGKLDAFHAWLNKSDYNSIMDLLLKNNFFMFKKTYFDQFTFNNETTFFISIKIWGNDGSHILETRAFRGIPIPSNLSQLWEKLNFSINSNTVNFELKSSSSLFINGIDFFMYLLLIFIFLRKKRIEMKDN